MTAARVHLLQLTLPQLRVLEYAMTYCTEHGADDTPAHIELERIVTRAVRTAERAEAAK